jgi:hypothetical protein
MKGRRNMSRADRAHLKLFQAICDEAVAQCGADTAGIESYVEGAIRRLPAARQRTLRGTLERMLKDQSALDKLAKPSRLS